MPVLLKPSIALLRTQSDERLVALAREGSEAAFQAIVERYRRQVLGACRRILPEARAEDAAQQVFLAAWNALTRGDDVHDVRPWLLRIARNTALNALRLQGFDYDELKDGLRVSEAPQSELERRDVIRQTLAGLAALPERQREALLRSAVEGASHADIARSLGLSEGATRQLVLRARTAMRSAATALTPWPLISWAAQSGAGGGGGIAEIATGGGAAGATALLAKAGTVAVLATGVIAGPSVLEGNKTAEADDASRTVPAAVTPAPKAPAATADRTDDAFVTGASRTDDQSGRGSSGHGRSGDDERGDDNSGPGSGRDDDERSGSDDDNSGSGSGSSGTGSGGSDDDHSGSGSGSSGSEDDHSGSGSSGSGSGGDDASSGSGSSGSGSSGSGSGEALTEPDDGGSGSGSGSSGSGSSGSGSDSSGSGSSGSGSDDLIDD